MKPLHLPITGHDLLAVERFQDSTRSLSADEVEVLLDGIDFHALLQAVRHHAETVFAFATQGNQPKSFNYRGAELFNQRATLLYDDFDQSTAEAVLTTRSMELWLLEDMTVTAVASVSVVCEGGAYVAEYREDLGDRGQRYVPGPGGTDGPAGQAVLARP